MRLLTSSTLLCATLLTLGQACLPPIINGSALSIGTDGPADPATLGWTLNHFGLIVNDLTASLHFYGNILGMRHVFTYQASDTYEIAYMGYSHGGKNGTGYQSGEELFNEKTNIEGLLEFVYLKNCTGPQVKREPSTIKANTFSHVGLVVPDLKAAEGRMEAFGVTILKHVGEDLQPGNPAANAFGFQHRLAEARAAASGLDKIGFQSFMMVVDPDGNVVEIQQQV